MNIGFFQGVAGAADFPGNCWNAGIPPAGDEISNCRDLHASGAKCLVGDCFPGSREASSVLLRRQPVAAPRVRRGRHSSRRRNI